MNAVILFIICTAVNVILSTIKSIATIKGGKFMAALTYGFYSWVIILTNYIDVVKWGVFTIYCETQKDTAKALEIAKQ